MKALKKYTFAPDYAIPPGETLKEVMESLQMTQKELAVRTGLTVQSLNRIFKGEQPITYETSERLEMVTGIPVRFWNNLEMQYQEQLVKIEEKKRLKSDLQWLKKIPLKELKERNVIPEADGDEENLRNTLKFFGVSSVDAWNDIWETPAVAARRSQCFETMPEYASTWIRLGEIQALNCKCRPYNKQKFLEALNKIRSLTKEPIQIFVEQLISLCSEAGVAVALVKEMKKVPWSGAAKWLSKDKAMILLNLRGKREDKLLFSFFHEAGHILHDSKKELYINDGDEKNICEQRANRFAADFLIPIHYDSEIKKIRSRKEVIALSEEIGVSPGIIAGRFQFLTKKWTWFSDFIRKLDWSE